MSRLRIALDRDGRRELPFAIGVIAPLSGDRAGRGRWLRIDRDEIDGLFAKLAPELTLPQGTFTFRSLDDFEPAALARHVQDEPSAAPRPADGKSLIDSLLGEAPAAAAPKRDDFMSGLIDEALAGSVVHQRPAPGKRLHGESAVRAVLREPAFRRLEAAWRGLYHLVRSADTDATLKLKVFDGRREDVAAAVEQACAPSDEPFGLIVADFAFGPSDAAVAELYPHAKRLAAAACALVAGWEGGDEGAAWPVFRKLDAARHVALAGPRVLARPPHTDADGAPFAEVTRPADADQYVWMNAAFHVAAAVAGGVARTGWFAELHGTRLADLPAFPYKDEDGDAALRCPLEEALDDRLDREWSALGVLTLVHVRNSDQAILPVARSVQTPARHEEEELAYAAAVMGRLPFVLAAGRFVHAARLGGAGVDELNAWLSDYVSARGPLLEGQAVRRGGRLELYLHPWLGREELPGAVAVEA